MKRKKVVIGLIAIAIMAFAVVFFTLSNGHPVDGNNNSVSMVDNSQSQAVPTPAPTVTSSPESAVTPTPEPEPKTEPAVKPTLEPTTEQTEKPTPQPTTESTAKPTAKPTPETTQKPTPKPTPEPTEKPTAKPTAEPTEKPTPEPTAAPKPEPNLGKHILTTEDVKRIMNAAAITDSPYYLGNDEFKQKVPNYSIYVDVAKDYMELRENYNYKDLATEAGRKKFEAALSKYSPRAKEFQDKLNNERISYIISNKLIQKSVFLTSNDCIFKNGDRQTIVRGVLYFVILETHEEPKEFEEGVEYKVDIELYLSGGPSYTEPEQFKVTGYDALSDIVKIK